MQASSAAQLNTLRSRQSRSTPSSSDTTLHKAQGTEIITSHMATAALRSQSQLGQQSCLGSSRPQPCPPPSFRGARGGRGGEVLFPMGQGLRFGRLWPEWEAWWDGEPCSSGISHSFPWVWQPESLWATLPVGNEPSRLSGPVPVTHWRDDQQAPDHLPGAPPGQQQQQRVQAAPGRLRADLLHVCVDASQDFWHLEGTRVRMVLPFPSLPAALTWLRVPERAGLGQEEQDLTRFDTEGQSSHGALTSVSQDAGSVMAVSTMSLPICLSWTSSAVKASMATRRTSVF